MDETSPQSKYSSDLGRELCLSDTPHRPSPVAGRYRSLSSITRIQIRRLPKVITNFGRANPHAGALAVRLGRENGFDDLLAVGLGTDPRPESATRATRLDGSSIWGAHHDPTTVSHGMERVVIKVDEDMLGGHRSNGRRPARDRPRRQRDPPREEVLADRDRTGGPQRENSIRWRSRPEGRALLRDRARPEDTLRDRADPPQLSRYRATRRLRLELADRYSA